MDKRQFFIEAVQAGAHLNREWVLQCFSVIRRPPSGTNESENYPYRIVTSIEDPEKLFFIDPQNSNQHTLIDESSIKEPILKFKDRLELQPNDLPNVSAPVSTTYGNAIANLYILVYAFGSKVEFITGRITRGILDKIVAARLADEPGAGDPIDPKAIYNDEYIRFCEGCDAIATFGPICAPSASPKTLVVDPAVHALRDQLYIKYKDRLHDPATLAEIDAQLVALDKASFKGDSSEGFFISAKAFNVSRKKMFGTYGLERGMGAQKDVVIRKSLSEGWDINNLPALVESSRAASYDRGHQTMLGGFEVKNDYRRFQNSKVIMEDCGVNAGLVEMITSWNWRDMVGLYAQEPKTKKTYLLTEEFLKAHIGKHVMTRSPMICKATAPSFCSRCVGVNVARLPSGIHIATSNVGSVFMNTFMKAMHGKMLSTAKYDFKYSIT